MRIDFNRAALATALGFARAAIPSKTSKPVLLNVLLRVSGESAVLIGTDTEITIHHQVMDFTSDGNGQVLLPAGRVSEVLGEMKDERVTLDTDSKVIQLRGSRGKFNIPTADPAEFPSTADEIDQPFMSVPGNLLRKMIRRTIFSTSNESNNYALGGVLFETQGGLTLVATDSRRLSLVSAKLDSPLPDNKSGSGVVPTKALSLVERVIPDSTDAVQIALSSSSAVFKTAQSTVRTRLVAGRFPRYRDVLPRSHNIAVSLIAGALYEVIRQSMIFTSEESRGVDFEFTPGTLKLTSQGAEIGDSEVEIPVGYEGDKTVIRLDPRWFADFLKTIPAESQIDLKIIDDDSPAVISVDDSSTYVVMPLSREG